jgi:hypothetical protein
MGYIIDFLLGAGGSVFAAEVCASAQPVAKRLICVAVRYLPREEQERCREEWVADLSDMPGVLAKSCWVGGCCWAVAASNGRAWRSRQLVKRRSDEARMKEIAELVSQFEELEARIGNANDRAERVKVICKLMRAVRAERRRHPRRRNMLASQVRWMQDR